MKKHFYLLFAVLLSGMTAQANVGDTTWVNVQTNMQLTHYGAFDTTAVFPSGSVQYRKIYMIFTLGQYNCAPGSQYCHQWDYDLENYIMTPGGDTLELSRFITPYATTGTPGFGPTWQQHYIFDVTDFYPLLKDTAGVRIFYSGYSWGFNLNVQFAFIEGTPERNVIGVTKLWDAGYTYGNIASPIDSNLLPVTITPPAGTVSAEMKLAITGHGADATSECCEFDATGVGHTYTVLANNNTVGQKNMNINCGLCELYPQGGTWAYARAGNWCPGGLVQVYQYPLGLTAGTPAPVDINFDDTYNGGSSYGDYKIAATAFYYAGYNKTLDASMEDVIAPTSFEWYRRENPRASAPVIKIRNTGSTTITTMLIQYGVVDSVPQQYIWTGSLPPLTDDTITMPALISLTNLSLNPPGGNYQFTAQILQVNGQSDNDPSNDTITSYFALAPTYPYQFAVDMLTSTWGANGNLGSNPADASWQITDQNNVVVASRTNTDVATQYKDTVNLVSAGFYALTVTTLQCFGLNWWVWVGQSGYSAGNLKVLDINSGNAELTLDGSNPGNTTYHDDFGCGFVQYFTTTGQCNPGNPTITRVGDTLYASAGSSYQWYYNGTSIYGATNSTYGMTHNDGNYTVKVGYGGGCFANSAPYSLINLGLTDLTDVSSVMIAPNPVTDVFAMHVSDELIGSPYTLSDLTGRQVLTGEVSGPSTSVAVAGLSPGIYLLNVGGQNRQSFKIMKQ